MTYGLKVLNGDGRTIINSDQGYPNTELSLNSNIASTEANRVTFTSNSNLVFTRPNTTTGGPYGAAISKSVVYTGQSGTNNLIDHWMTNYSSFKYSSSGSYKVATLSNQSSPATPSEYGLQVFDSLGTTTLLMTEGFSVSFDILYAGVATTSTTTFGNINWQTDSNIYVLVNNTNHTYTNVTGTSYESFTGYVFESNGTLTYRQEFWVGGTTSSFFSDISGNDYLVVRIKQ